MPTVGDAAAGKEAVLSMTPALLSLPSSCPTSLDLPPRDYCLTRPQLLTHASPSPGGGDIRALDLWPFPLHLLLVR